MTDILEQLKEESLRLARGSFDSVDYGLAANIADAAIDEIERLRDTLASAQRIIERDYPNGQLAIDIRNALSGTQPQPAQVTEALAIAEDVLSRAPFSTAILPNGMHPQVVIEKIRAALAYTHPRGGGK